MGVATPHTAVYSRLGQCHLFVVLCMCNMLRGGATVLSAQRSLGVPGSRAPTLRDSQPDQASGSHVQDERPRRLPAVHIQIWGRARVIGI